MSERIVVSFRMSDDQVTAPGVRYLDEARALMQKAEALGATLASWSAMTMSFAWDAESLDEAIEIVSAVRPAGETPPRWACGIAQGEVESLAEKGGGRGDLAWGPALVAAVKLARGARAGEALLDPSVRDLAELVSMGPRFVRDGERRMRATRLDVRQPWKKDARASVSRIVRAPLIGRPDPRSLLAQPGTVHVVRADPGLGGTRFLAEVAAAAAPGHAIFLSPAGASVEPLGGLRRALVRALASAPNPVDADLTPVLDMFLGGIGASMEQAASILAGMTKPVGNAPATLLIDDAAEIDAESLEACAQLVAWLGVPIHVIVRVDATDSLPGALADLPMGSEVELERFAMPDAQRMARALMSDQLDARATKRWGKRGAGSPLGITEALEHGLSTGELAWIGDRASPRTRVAGRGKGAPASYWIGRRAKLTASDERGVLAAIALLGGEASRAVVKEVLAAAETGIDVEAQIVSLVAQRLLLEIKGGWVSLPSRTHRDTIAELLDEAPRRALHLAIADVIEREEGELGCAEAAHHAVKAGDRERGAKLAIRAARAASAAGMKKSASRLVSLARLADPKCEPLARKALISSLPPAPILSSGPPPIYVPHAPRTLRTIDDVPTEKVSAMSAADAARVIDASRDSEPPTMVDTSAPVPFLPSPVPLPLPSPIAPAPAPPMTTASPQITDMEDRTIAGIAPAPRIVPARPPPIVRKSVTGMQAVVVPRASGEVVAPSNPREPLPMRPSVQGMQAVRPNNPPPLPARASVQGMPAVRPSPTAMPVAAPAPQPPSSQGMRAAPVVAQPPSPKPGPVAPVDDDDPAIARQLASLAKAALVSGDAGALEKWTEGLRAAGDHARFATRLEAMAFLSRGRVGDALRVLRKERDETATADADVRAQATLALGVALASASRDDEALLEGLDALARAREANDDRATAACLAFLAKLFTRNSRDLEAASLREASKRNSTRPLPAK